MALTPAGAAAAGASAPSAPRPSAAGSTLTYFGNNSSFATVPSADRICNEYYSATSEADRLCLATTQNPSAVALANGDVGVAFSQITTQTSDTCTGASSNTAIRIGWASSSDGGAKFGPVDALGNETCAWQQATEPSFGVLGNGTVVGTYVQYNSVNASPTLGAKSWGAPWNYNYRVNATLGFVASFDDGSTWATPITLAAVGNYVARPSLATFGQTIYVAYDHLSATQQVYTGSSQNPKYSSVVSVELVYSANGGASWKGPYALPGLNSTEFNTSMSPSVAVAANGTLAVAYLTNRSCQLASNCKASSSSTFGDDVVVATSAANGTSWNGPYRVAPGMLEDQQYGALSPPDASYTGYRYLFEFGPAPVAAYDGGQLLVAYAGSNATRTFSTFLGVYVASSSNGGIGWTTSTIYRAAETSDDIYSPALAVNATGVAFLSYTWENETSCPATPCSPFYDSFSAWVDRSGPNATDWGSPIVARLYHPAEGLGSVDGDWTGWSASLAVDPATQAPVAFFALPSQDNETQVTKGGFTWYNDTWLSNLTAAYPYSAATTTVNFTESGLSGGAVWGVVLEGQAFLTSAGNLSVAGVPVGEPLLASVHLPPVRGWTQISATLPGTGFYRTFTASENVTVNYTEAFGFSIAFHPASSTSSGTTCEPYCFLLSLSVGSKSYTYEWDYSSESYAPSPAFPWYLPGGHRTELTPTADGYPGYSWWNYWHGTGAGNYTGTGVDANLTPASPVNESVWAVAFGTGNVTVDLLGVPATSVVQFDLGGTAYRGPASATIDLANVTDGVIPISNITANSSRPGYEYFGRSGSGPTLVVPLQQQLNLSFALVDVAGALGNVTVEAVGIAEGTSWQAQLNGTTYESDASSLEVDLRNGTYPYSLPSAIASNGSEAYLPETPSGWVNATTGGTVELDYTFSYRFEAVAGLGGTVSGSSLAWVAPGASEEISATAQSGYEFAGWTGNGTGAYTGPDATTNVTVEGPTIESAQFYALPTAHFNATFTEEGLGAGIPWTVFVGGVGYSSNTSEISVGNLLSCSAPGGAGVYALSVPYAYNLSAGTRFVPGKYPATFCTNGVYTRNVTFTPEFLLSVSATSGGLALVGAGTGESNQSLWVPFDEAPSITASSLGNSSFLYWNGTGPGSYSGPNPFEQLPSVAGPVSELAVFVPPVPKLPSRYTLTIYGAGLPANQTWEAIVNGTGHSATGPEMNVTGLTNGSYSLVVPDAVASDGLTRYSAPGASPAAVVKGPSSATVDFDTAYWVVVAASAGGSVSPSGGGWYARGETLTLNATPEAGYLFAGWSSNGTGANGGNYSGPSAAPPPFRVSGPLEEYALFERPPPGPKALASPFASPAAWAVFAGIGVAVGIGVGVALARRRGSTPPGPVEGPEPEAEGPPALEEPGSLPEAPTDDGSGPGGEGA